MLILSSLSLSLSLSSLLVYAVKPPPPSAPSSRSFSIPCSHLSAPPTRVSAAYITISGGHFKNVGGFHHRTCKLLKKAAN